MSQINLNHTTPAAPGGNTNVTWQTDASNNVSGYVPNSTLPLTTKGDILGYDSAADRIPVGTDGQVLTADSGQSLGVKWDTPSSSSGGVIGTAKFTTSAGVIGGLVTQGQVSGVTRTGTGAYAVTLTGSPSAYLVIGTGGDATEPFIISQIDPVTSYGTSGFTIQYFGGGAAYDPALVFITVILL